MILIEKQEDTYFLRAGFYERLFFGRRFSDLLEPEK